MTYTKLLKENAIVRNLSIVEFIAYFASWFSNVAIYTMLVEFKSSEFAIAVVTSIHFLPAVLIAPFSGAIIDKFRIKPLMFFLILTELLMTLCFLSIDNKNEIWLLMIFIFIRMSASSMIFSSGMALFARILKGDSLKKANEIHTIIWSFTYAAGMAVSGVVVAYVGVKTSIIIDAILFFIALLIFSQIKMDLKTISVQHKILELIKDGYKYLRNNRLIVHLILLHSCVGLTSFDTLVTLLAKNNYKYIIAVPLSIGITNATRAIALMIGPLLISKYINKDNFNYVLIAQGLAIILWGMTQYNFYVSLFFIFLTGFFTTTIWSYTYALIQENCDDSYLGRVISYNDMFFMIACIIVTLFIGLMATLTSLAIITSLLGLGFIAFSFYYKKIVQWL